jgi:hypothetical protein
MDDRWCFREADEPWQRAQTSPCRDRRPEECDRPAAANGERREQRRVLGESSAIRRRVGEDEDGQHGERLPPVSASDARRNAQLRIDTAEEGLDGCKDGLDLDHRQEARTWMPGEQVDATAVAEVIEADLGAHLPSPALQALLPGVLDEGMVRIEEPCRLT